MQPTSNDVIAAAEAPLEAVLVRREEIEQATNPDLRMKDYVVLKDGPQAFKIATHWEIVDRKTGEFHHHKLRIDTYYRRKAGWKQDDRLSVDLGQSDPTDVRENHVILGAEGGDELQKLMTFLRSVQDERLPDAQGQYLVIPIGDEVSNDASLGRLLEVVSDAGKAGVVASALEMAKGDPDVLRALAERAAADPDASKGVAAALNLASFKKELRTLDELIEQDVREGQFQQHLERNPWMFGSEYSKLLDKRNLTVGQQQDFMLRRTADAYLEIVEIKTVLAGNRLFLFDESHQSYYPRRELSEVLGQVMYYLEEIDAARDNIERRIGEKVNKVRAKIVIGRDIEQEQVDALRRFNSHLNRIEIITFDQLRNIAGQVVGYLEQSMTLPGETSAAGG